MNKKCLIFTLALILGVQHVRPTAWYENTCNQVKNFLSSQNSYSLGALGAAGIASVCGAYKYIKGKIDQKRESWAQQADEKLIQEAKNARDFIYFKYKQELDICKQAGNWQNIPAAQQAVVVQDLASFFIKNKISIDSYIHKLEGDVAQLESKIQQLKDRKSKRYQQLQEIGSLQDFDSAISQASFVFNHIETFYNVMKTELTYFALASEYANVFARYIPYIELCHLYNAGSISSLDYTCQLHAIIESNKSAQIQFPYLASERKLNAIVHHFEEKINDLCKNLILNDMCRPTDEMSIISSDLIDASNAALQALKDVYNFIIQSKQHHKEIKKEKKQQEKERELQRQQEIERKERLLRERELELQRQMVEEQVRQNRILAEQNRFKNNQPPAQQPVNVTVIVSQSEQVKSGTQKPNDNSAQLNAANSENPPSSDGKKESDNQSIVRDPEKFLKTMEDMGI